MSLASDFSGDPPTCMISRGAQILPCFVSVSFNTVRHPQSHTPFDLEIGVSCVCGLSYCLNHGISQCCLHCFSRDGTVPASMFCILTWENVPYIPSQDEVNERVYQNEPTHPGEGSVVSNHWGLIHVVPLQTCK